MSKNSSGISKPNFTAIINKITPTSNSKLPQPKKTHKKNDSGFCEELFSPIPIKSKSKNIINKKISLSASLYPSCLELSNTPKKSTAIRFSKKGRLVYNDDPKLNAWFKAPLAIALKWKGFAPEAQFRNLCHTTSKSTKVGANKNTCNTFVNATESGFTHEAIIEKFVKLECDAIYLEARAKVIARRWAAKRNAVLNAKKRIDVIKNGRKSMTTRDSVDVKFEFEEKLGWKKIEAFRKLNSQAPVVDTKIVVDIEFYLDELEGWSRIDTIKSELSQYKNTDTSDNRKSNCDR
ncbi:12213_t:CDS:2 [Ambispora gerdemannii]|uniref:12213_t:CDS:1 n=1 Tax=Ambispora gerdemannii TaxID=144530 RepID=A0A9N8ZS29_9GLOM|nr:12213_t:CDS:2 [Ambispora gerdemannii]